jgi:hypothetical protein
MGAGCFACICVSKVEVLDMVGKFGRDWVVLSVGAW